MDQAARPRRIYGLETEFGVASAQRVGDPPVTGGAARQRSADEVARLLFRGVVTWGRSSNVFLGNGSRVYLDVGSHPEYATAECDSLRDVIIHDRAGEQILDSLARDTEKQLADSGNPHQVYLFKNNTDSHHNSYGCHENYLIPRAGEFARYAEVLIPFLVSRPLICGAGKILVGNRGASFVLSQRAEHMWESVSSSTTRSRPMINTRDEPHADPERYRRLHVIVGDSNLSELTTLLKLASMELVLRIVEHGIPMRDVTCDNPIRAIRDVSADLTGRARISLANGQTISALDLQQVFLEVVSTRVELDDDPLLARALELWERCLAAIESGNLHTINTEIDWAIKHQLLQRYAARHGVELADPRLQRLDLAYHDIREGRGALRLLERAGRAARLSTDAEVASAVSTPPQTTRAKLRGEFITAAMAAGAEFTADWVHLKLIDQTQRTVLCKDPFLAVDERVDRLIASMAHCTRRER